MAESNASGGMDSDAGRYRALLEKAERYAERRRWQASGRDVFYRLFAEKYHWLPSQVRTLSVEELELLSKEDFDPPRAR